MDTSKRMLVRYLETILDVVCMIGAYLLANKVKFGRFRTGILNPEEPYMTLLVVILISYFIVSVLFPTKKYVLQRNVFEEVINISRMLLYMMGITLGYLYFVKASELFSRVHLALFVVMSACFMFFGRLFLKRFITKTYHRSGANEKIMLITTFDAVEEVVKQIKKTRNWYFRISNIAIVDKDMVGEVVNGIEVVATKDNILQEIETSAIDSAFLHLPQGYTEFKTEIIEEMCAMGKHAHVNIAAYNIADELQTIQKLGKYAVVTYRGVYHRARYRAVKRTADILVGAVGSFLILPVLLMVAIGNFLEKDAGHSIISLLKVGKNGRRFYMYKFRTMYLDEERRNSENPYSKTGRLIRVLGLENLPVMWNVFWGDMSIIGTKAPSLPEFLAYPRNRRKTLYAKPGLIGLWQVGINPLQKNEELDIAELDEYYVNQWTLGLDIQVFLKSIVLLFTRGKKKA